MIDNTLLSIFNNFKHNLKQLLICQKGDKNGRNLGFLKVMIIGDFPSNLIVTDCGLHICN